jgi:hypothetical protein
MILLHNFLNCFGAVLRGAIKKPVFYKKEDEPCSRDTTSIRTHLTAHASTDADSIFQTDPAQAQLFMRHIR